MTGIFIKYDVYKRQILCQGEWVVENLPELKKELSQITWPAETTIVIDGQAIKRMDSAGAWLLNQFIGKIEKKGSKVQLENFSEQYLHLIEIVGEQKDFTLPHLHYPNWLARVGKTTTTQLFRLVEFLSFIGEITLDSFRVITHPRRWRWPALFNTIDKAGFQALPIIALMSFMVGMVITYQTGLQLKKYGASVFIVELLGFAILREFGPLITAIMVAGRTGSAFTAQLGLMKINQEIDALNTMGVTPTELLIMPRIIGLVIALPLLTVWADIFGVLGGMVTTENILNITWTDFLNRFQQEVPLKALLIGLGKAPIFALIIGSIACFQGMSVEKTAESLGKLTTRSVVLSIFFIIVADAIFSIVFNQFRL